MVRHSFKPFAMLLMAIALPAIVQSHVFAQGAVGGAAGVGGGAAGAAGGATQGTQGGQGAGSAIGGVEIDAQGVLRARAYADPAGALTKQRMAAARAVLTKDVMRRSDFRKVSLNRLERELEKCMTAGETVDNEMLYLAGLTRITHVFYLPESNDVVIAGPAEGFYADPSGKVRGMETGLSTLELRDLIVALRAFGPESKPTSLIACSIDPTQEGLQNLQETIRLAQQNFQRGMELEVVRAFRNALGMQTVTIKGVSPKTHFAQVLAEADYRMKLIGIGLERPNVPISTFIDNADPIKVGNNALQRWYFEPNYECVQISADQNAMRMVGSGVKLVGEDERVGADGTRSATGKSNRASRKFCKSFTENYDQLAEEVPVFGELRNIIDMSIAAAFIQQMDLYGRANWQMKFLGDESRVPVETSYALQQVEPAINAVWRDGVFMTPIGGGIAVRPTLALSEGTIKVDETGEVDQARQGVNVDKLADDQWWWD